MEEFVIDNIVINSKKQIAWAKQFEQKRHLFGEIKAVDEEYYLGIKGIRGVGKTVLMLQLASETDKSVYFSADSTQLKPIPIYEIVRELLKRGFKNMFIDEIHRKAGWDSDIKTVFDEHGARVIFSGSSSIDITKTGADLSRRAIIKELRPISFREYLNIRKNRSIKAFSVEEIIKHKAVLANKYAEESLFLNEYLTYGGVLYPKNGFFEAMENSLRKVILQDLSALREINVKYETDVYKLLYIIAKSPPFETNYSSISSALEVSKSMAIRMVDDLARAGIIIPIFPCKKEGINVKKEPKIYLTIPLRQLISKLGTEINKGAYREEFFVNHIRNVCYLKTERGEKTPDFRLNNFTVEVGSESKTNIQKPDYIATDSLATSGNKIPLFLFGFTY